LRLGHTQACDWWSQGVILYEMVFGRPPFLSDTDNPRDTQYMILNWRDFLILNGPMWNSLSPQCVDLIAKLCCDEKDRLGRNGAFEIKNHVWFEDIDFTNLRKSRPEFVPKVEHPEDTSNFDTFEVKADEILRNADEMQSSYNPAFFDFTFRHFFANDSAQIRNHPSACRSQHRPSLAPLLEMRREDPKLTAKMKDESEK